MSDSIAKPTSFSAAILARIQRSMRPKPAPENPAAGALEKLQKQPATPGRHRHYDEMGWARGLLTQEVLVTALCAVFVVLIWAAVLRVRMRPPAMVVLPSTLAEQMEDLSAVPIDFDILSLYLRTTLPLLNQADDVHDSSALNVLKGCVHPDILEKARRAVDAKQKVIREQGVLQNLHLGAVRKLVTDEATKRVTCYIDGFVSILYERSETGVKPVRLDFCARVVLEKNTPSKLNPFPFFMVEREQRYGTAAHNWIESLGGAQ